MIKHNKDIRVGIIFPLKYLCIPLWYLKKFFKEGEISWGFREGMVLRTISNGFMKKVVLEISSKSWTYVYMMHTFLALPCKILVSQPRIELLPPAVKVES